MLRDVNRNPRRWRDESGRIRVVEGWHPSQPERVGYNLLLDGTWLGTFETLDSAAAAASAARPHSEGRAPVRLSLEHAPQRRSDRPRLHIVDPVPDDD